MTARPRNRFDLPRVAATAVTILVLRAYVVVAFLATESGDPFPSPTELLDASLVAWLVLVLIWASRIRTLGRGAFAALGLAFLACAPIGYESLLLRLSAKVV